MFFFLVFVAKLCNYGNPVSPSAATSHWFFVFWKAKVEKTWKMRLEICYMEQCLKFLYDLI